MSLSLIPRTDLAIEFLQKWQEKGPWTLSAATPNQGEMSTKAFDVEMIPQMEQWIEGWQNKRNIYFTVNPVKQMMNIKPKKTDIAQFITLHCDCDPRIGEDFDQERLRILHTLKNFEPRPSVIIDSGGGYQAFFLLEEPVPQLDGTEEMAEEYERYNQQLEILLGGDHCFNADRLLRLPGTINIPSDKKIKKGRAAALALVVEWLGTKYPLSLFTKAQTKVQQVFAPGTELLPGGGEKVKISGNIVPLYVEDLLAKNILVPDSIKVLIVQGIDLDNPNKYPSRSEPLFAVTCALARAGADDDTIAGIIMNRDNKISASILDKPRPERYAAKQIQDAREEIDDPVLRELNNRHAVISDIGGKCRIISEIFDHSLKRPRVSYQSFLDFMNRYMNRRVQVATDKEGQPVMKAAGKWWIEHTKRRQYETIVFAPGKEVPQAYNLWQGFSCDSFPGDCSLFLEHIKKNLCLENEDHYNYLLGWMARCVQQPDCPGEVAVVLRGEMGTGKGVFAKGFGSLFGRHFLQISDAKHLVGSFNSHLRDCVVIFSDEAFWAGDKKHESVLKALVTEETLAIESKGVDVLASPNYTHIILASNSNWVIPAGANERRFFALDVSKENMQNKKYFAAIREQMDKGGKEALLHYLLNYDISNYEVRDVPKTAALQDQKLLSYSSEESWWYEKLEEGRVLKEHDCWEREIMKNPLQDDYVLYMQRVGILRKASPTVLGKFLGRVCPGGVPRSFQRPAKIKVQGSYGEELLVTRKVYFYELPELSACREQWDKHHGGPFKWPEPLEKAEQIEMKTPESVFK